MNLYKYIIFIFRKKKDKDNNHTKRPKAKRRFFNTKQKSKKAKRKPKIFVPPTVENSNKESGNKSLSNQPPRSTVSTSNSNHKARIPSQVKLVITGSVGAGKTTAIRALSDKEPISTEARPTDEVSLLKATTTTSLDYGTFIHSLKSKIHLYGTPGQKRFSFMGAILTEGASGLIILINNNQEEPLLDLKFYLTHNKDFLQSNKAVIGITHYDVNRTHHISEYINFIGKFGMRWPVVPIDARESADVLKLVDLIINATFLPTRLKA
jgi:signal recognition particle receptor subunit beta